MVTYEQAISFLGVHLRETCTRVHQMMGWTLTAALFTISPDQKQLQHQGGKDKTKVVEDCGSPIHKGA